MIGKEGLEESPMSEKLHKIVLFSSKTAGTSKEQAEGCREIAVIARKSRTSRVIAEKRKDKAYRTLTTEHHH
jgi:hypothetical protein